MTLSGVDITQIDGALGVSGDTTGDIFAVVGCSTTGTVNYPVAFVNPADIIAYFGAGPLVEHATYLAGGKPVVCVRASTVTAGTCGTIDVTGKTGTSTVTLDVGAACDNEYEAQVKVVNGGTIGTAGILLQYSLDGGYNWSTNVALGTAVFYTIPNSGGVRFNFAAGTLIANDIVKSRTVAPVSDAAGIIAAQTALKASQIQWDAIHVCEVLDATKIIAWDTYIDGLWTNPKKHKKAVSHVRGQTIGEANATWQTALAGYRTTATSKYLAVCAGYVRVISRVSGRNYRMPCSLEFSRIASKLVRPSRQDIAEVALGPTKGALYDINGVLQEHNEEVYPGLNDLHYVVCRTRQGSTGTYFESPNIFCPDGSDFYLWQYRSVTNKVADVVNAELFTRLRKPVRVNKATGFIKEADAIDIENGVNSAIRDATSAGPDLSDYKFTLSRTDNLLAAGAITHGSCRIVPLAYTNNFGITIGFVNPARGTL